MRRPRTAATPVAEYFHASEDKQEIRDRVFALLQKHEFSIQATISEKSKAMPQIRPTNHRFYQYGWFYHFKHAAPKLMRVSLLPNEPEIDEIPPPHRLALIRAKPTSQRP